MCTSASSAASPFTGSCGVVPEFNAGDHFRSGHANEIDKLSDLTSIPSEIPPTVSGTGTRAVYVSDHAVARFGSGFTDTRTADASPGFFENQVCAFSASEAGAKR